MSEKVHFPLVLWPARDIQPMGVERCKEIIVLSNLIPNYDLEMEKLRGWGSSGFILAFNLTFRGPEHLHSEYPLEWRRIYEKRNYFFTDPILVWAVGNSGNRRWSEVTLPDIRGTMAEARKFDLNYGAVFSRKSEHKRSFLTISRPDREFSDTEIEIIGEKFDVWVDIVIGRKELTEAELDVLRGLKDGLGQAAIAARLGISESTVKQRALKACSKLGAQTRTQAVAIAVARNYFDI